MHDFIMTVYREKGLRFAYNYFHYLSFYNTTRPRLVNILKKFEPYPNYIEIENTTYCNLRCLMCEHTYWKEKPRSINFDQFKAIVDQFPRLKWIGLTGIGESYINRDFSKMLRYCAERKLITEIYDVFYFIDEEKARELIDLGIDQVYCSMDGATKETYEKIRVRSDFDRVVENIRRFVRIRQMKGKVFPILDFHFIISRINHHEIIKYIELVSEIAPGSKIQFTRLLHKYPEIEDYFVEVSEETMARAQQRAAELGVTIYWNANTSFKKPPMHNCVTWYMPFVFATGEVIPCCSTNEANRREDQKATSLGNVFTTPFRDIWYGTKYSRLRKDLREGRIPSPCADCCVYRKPPEMNGSEI